MASKGITTREGRATIYPPTDAYKTWRISYKDPLTQKRRTTSGGHSRTSAEDKLAHLLGDYVPNQLAEAPTVQDFTDRYLENGAGDWSERTQEQYLSLTRKLTSLYGDIPITRITPDQIKQIPLVGISRGQRKRFRTVVKGVFKEAEHYLRVPVETYSQAVSLGGTKSADPMVAVSSGDIPSTKLVASLVIVQSRSE